MNIITKNMADNVMKGEGSSKTPTKPPCRACTDFKSWTKVQKKGGSSKPKGGSSITTPQQQPSDTPESITNPPNCPADREELGRSTWTYLHTMAAYYPDQPSQDQQAEMKELVQLFSHFYPCDDCADHMRKWMETHPPVTNTRHNLSQWMCGMHNEVNERLDKPIFDCSRVDERWLDGWKDGSCD